MLRRRLAICLAVICATLVFPQHARAGLGDIIWEMTGPQMVGAIIRCRIPFGGGARQCGVQLVAPDPKLAAAQGTEAERVWVAVEGGPYVSTGKNAEDTDYKFGRIWMFAFEPMLEFRYDGDISRAYEKNSRVGAVYGGFGPMVNRFLVKGPAESFTKYGIKLRPIAIAYNGWAIEYNIRLYPDGFTPDQFGFGTPVDFNRPFEAVQSVSVSVPWLKWRFGR